MSSRRRFYWIGGLWLLVLCGVPVTLWIRDSVEYFYQHREGSELLKQLRDRRPPDVNPDTWEYATSWAITAYGNVCFSEAHVSLEELKRFCADLKERLRGPVNLATVDWIWERLGRTGSHGRQYRERFEPQYRETLQAALESDRRKH